jgi:DNA-binding CsgD family transcriptional regulator
LLDEIAALSGVPVTDMQSRFTAHLALRCAYLGDTPQAQQRIAACFAEEHLHASSTAAATFLLVLLLEAAVLVEDRATASGLLQRLAPLAECATADWSLTTVARHLGAAALLLGDRAQARAYYEQALAVAERIRFRPEVALTRLALAELLAGKGRDASVEERQHLEFAVAEFAAMAMQPALERAHRALEAHGSQRPAARLPAYPDGLSEREVDVLRLIAAGKTNKEIAEALVISINTVLRHVAHIFEKTGCANRAEAATYAARQGLTK